MQRHRYGHRVGCALAMLMLIILPACRKQVRPQAPANRPIVDSEALELVLSNMQLAERTTDELARSVHLSGLPFAQYEQGYWAMRTVTSDSPLLEDNEEVTLAMQVSEMLLPKIDSGRPIENSQLTVHVGKRETIAAVDMLLAEARRGERYTVLVPYFFAYGVAGNGEVGPYANLRVELEIY